jgi:hypothetical protein
MLDLNMAKKRLTIATVFMALLAGVFYLCCGLFIVHPLSASSDGTTYVYWRVNTNLPFICSADGLLITQTDPQKRDSITHSSRGATLSKMSDVVLQRRILKLPYSRKLYLLSTDGIELDR